MTRTGSRAAPALTRRAGAVAVAAVLVVLATAPPAATAHEAADGVRYRLTGVAPEVDGLTVQVVRGLAGQLVLANDTGEVVEVLDDAGRAFLRIGPDAVEADVASPTWAASDRPFGLGGGDPSAPSSNAPRWVTVSDDPSWGWYDHRLHESSLAPAPDATEPVVLATWSVPLRVGGRAVTVAGETVGGPPLGFVAARLVSDRAPAQGVAVTLLPGRATGLLLAVDDGHEALVRGEADEPFLRFAGGRVEANAASPTWHRTGGGQASAVAIDADADPVWQSVADSQRYGWIEPRATAPEVEGNPPGDTVLSTWAVPLQVDGRDTTVLGELRWVRSPAAPADTGGPAPTNLVLAGAGLAAVVGLVLVRRRGRPTGT